MGSPAFNPNLPYSRPPFDPSAPYQASPADMAAANSTGQGSSPDYGPDVTVVNPTWAGIGKGVLREGAQLASGAYGFGRGVMDAVPGVKDSAFGQQMQQNQQALDDAAQPRSIDEDFGKVGAQMASFLLPAKAESSLAELAPEELRFLARIGASSLSSGTMNALNGGGFGVGAATGAGIGAAGEAGRALAPQLVRSAIPGTPGIGKINTDAANTVLSETRGVKPSVALDSVNQRMAQAGEDLQRAAAAASQRDAPHIAGFLMPPKEEVPLATKPGRPPASQPMAYPAEMSPDFPAAGFNGMTREDAYRWPYNGPDVLHPSYMSGSAHPELSGRVPQPQGVLLRRPEMSASIPPTTQPVYGVPLDPVIAPVQAALDRAVRDRVPGDAAQLRKVMDFLHMQGDYAPEGGAPTSPPASLTTLQGLQWRRALSDNFINDAKWAKTINPPVLAATKMAYGALTQGVKDAAPGALEADEILSKLKPVQTGLKTLVKNDPSVVGNVAGRMAARTGALSAAATGAAAGAPHGPIGAIAGGLSGLVGPEVLSAPTTKLAMARGLYSSATPIAARSLITPAVQKLLDNIRGSDTESQE